MQINEVASVKLLKHVYVVSSLAFMSTNRLKISGAAYYYAVCYIHYIFFFSGCGAQCAARNVFATIPSKLLYPLIAKDLLRRFLGPSRNPF